MRVMVPVMNESADATEQRRLSSHVVLFSILGFWLFYVVIVTLRASLLEFPAQGEMAFRRGFVTAIGIFLTIGLWLVLRRFERQPIWIRVVGAILLSEIGRAHV